MRRAKVYVASSWRNAQQPSVVARLRDEGHEVYDFRNPAEGDHGFHWSSIDPEWQEWSPATYVQALHHPLAQAGFKTDMDALRWADAVVLVMPCGRSAHLELGWAVGAGKQTMVLLSDGEPELMNLMVDTLATTLDEVCVALQGKGTSE